MEENTPGVERSIANTVPVVTDQADADAVATVVAEVVPAVVVKDDAEGMRKLSERAQKAFDKITAKNHHLIQENQRLRAESEAARTKQEPVVPDTPPTPAQFAYDDAAFSKANAEYVRAVVRQESAAQSKALQEDSSRRERAEYWAEQEKSFAAQKPDYYEKAHYSPISDEVVAAVQMMDEGPAIAYYLGENPEDAKRISALPSFQRAKELGRIEERVIAKSIKPAVAAVTKAPPPPPRVNSTESVTSRKTTDASGDDMDSDAWFREEMKRVAAMHRKKA